MKSIQPHADQFPEYRAAVRELCLRFDGPYWRGVEERAAQKRVARALEKLRSIFAKRGVALTAGIIAGMITNGYLLTPKKIVALNDAGLEHLQISIDNLQPDDVSLKSLKVLEKKLESLSMDFDQV